MKMEVMLWVIIGLLVYLAFFKGERRYEFHNDMGAVLDTHTGACYRINGELIGRP